MRLNSIECKKLFRKNIKKKVDRTLSEGEFQGNSVLV